MLEQKFYIAGLIAKYLGGTLHPEEQKELETWRNASVENEALFQRICDKQHIEEHNRQRNAYDKQSGWLEIDRKLQRARRRTYILNFGKYAAIFIIPLIIGICLTTLPEDSGNATDATKGSQILPGAKKAILTLDDGKVVDLVASETTRLKEKDGTSIRIDSATLNYQITEKTLKAEKEVYNKVEIPRGGEYSLLLSDGTRVYLNSMSSLRFPVKFISSQRVVELQGEAYFEVSKNSKPFIVKTPTAEVEVLGTTFNISAYAGEEYQTTLLTGSVKVHANNGISQQLKPAEQARIAPGTNQIEVRQVDPLFYASWIKGKINFKDQRLEDILNTLSRWYDMDVDYKDEKVKDLKFGCSINRCKEITPFLNLLESTGKVSVSTNGKTIIIKNNY